jgi:gonadotropin-releasing hormone receptor
MTTTTTTTMAAPHVAEDSDLDPDAAWLLTNNLTPSLALLATQTTLLPSEMTFSNDTLVSVITYPILFVVAVAGNLTVFITLLRSKGFKNHVNVYIMHLAMADLIVAFIFMPMETVWHATVSWEAGDVACRICMFFR